MKSFTESLNEAASGDKEAYQAFFKKALKKFGVDEPDQLSGDKKKEFFDYVDKNWKADNETDIDEAANPFDIYSSMKGWEKASKDLEKALAKAKKMSDKKKAREYMFKVQKKYQKFGATDTEPNSYIRQELGMNEEVEITEGFDVPNIDYSKLKDYKGFQDINIKKMIKANNFAKFNVKTIQDVIVWLNMVAMQWKAGNLKEEVEIEEAVAVDMRTKGYREAVKRALLRQEKKTVKKKKDAYEVKNDDVLENDGVSSKPKKEEVTTADVATTPKPLSTMRRKKKDY